MDCRLKPGNDGMVDGRGRANANYFSLAFDNFKDLGAWCELADVDLGEMTESGQRLARPAAPVAVNGAWIAADARQFRLYRDDHLFRLEPRRRRWRWCKERRPRREPPQVLPVPAEARFRLWREGVLPREPPQVLPGRRLVRLPPSARPF